MPGASAGSFQEAFPTSPGITARFAVGVLGVGRFTGAHEAVARTVVRHGLVGLARRFHLRDRVGNRAVYSRIISGVETVNRGLNSCHRGFVWRWSVKNECCGQVRAMGCKTERLSASPAEARDIEFAVRGGQF